MKPKVAVPLTVIGVDIGKRVSPHRAWRGRKERRSGDWASETPSRSYRRASPVREACLSGDFVSRVLRALGYEPRIIPAIHGRRTTRFDARR
jgi:transposase